MQLTPDVLQAILPDAPVEAWTAPLNAAIDEFALADSTAELAMFLAQAAEESAHFRRLGENLNYSADGLLATFPKHFTAEEAQAYARQPQRIAARVYANRLGNGDEASGDGWTYRGRGIFQLTGRSLYAACGNDLGLDLVGNPDVLLLPGPACRSAGWYWRRNSLAAAAKAGDVKAVTRAINGPAMLGLPVRAALFERAQALLEIHYGYYS